MYRNLTIWSSTSATLNVRPTTLGTTRLATVVVLAVPLGTVLVVALVAMPGVALLILVARKVPSTIPNTTTTATPMVTSRRILVDRRTGGVV